MRIIVIYIQRNFRRNARFEKCAQGRVELADYEAAASPIDGKHYLGCCLLEGNLFERELGDESIDAVLAMQQFIAVFLFFKYNSVKLKRSMSNLTKKYCFSAKVVSLPFSSTQRGALLRTLFFSALSTHFSRSLRALALVMRRTEITKWFDAPFVRGSPRSPDSSR